MCMKNVNINCLMFNEYEFINKSVVNFYNIDDTITADLRQDSANSSILYKEKINFLLQLNILSDDDYIPEIGIRVKLISPSGKSAQLAEYTSKNIDINNKIEGVLCKKIGNLKSIITVNNLEFPDGEGKYFLKVFIKDISREEDKYETQFISELNIISAVNENNE